MDEDKMWNAVASGAAIGSVIVSKPLLERAWRVAFRSDPPGNPAHRDVAWRDALLWALLTGALVGVIRLVAQRAAAGAWYRVTGDYPEALAVTRP